jgi:hypothetical protein
MNPEKSTVEAVRSFITARPSGEPFVVADVLKYGTRAAVDQALSRLVTSGFIDRIARGVFVSPRISRHVGKVPPTAEKVAEAISRESGTVFEVHGAEAIRRLGLSTQVPMQQVFLTSGRSRIIPFGHSSIRLLHRSPRRLTLAGRPAGIALQALYYLGKESVTQLSVSVCPQRSSRRYLVRVRRCQHG